MTCRVIVIINELSMYSTRNMSFYCAIMPTSKNNSETFFTLSLTGCFLCYTGNVTWKTLLFFISFSVSGADKTDFFSPATRFCFIYKKYKLRISVLVKIFILSPPICSPSALPSPPFYFLSITARSTTAHKQRRIIV